MVVVWMRRLLYSAALLLTAILPVGALAEGAEPPSQSCYLDGWGDSLRCYRVAVDGESELAVMVAPAVNGSGGAPMYLLAGGPGQAASDLAPLLNAFRKVNREHDIVMVDRRGAGRSGAFRCGFADRIPSDLGEFSRRLADCYLERPDFAESLNSRQTVEDLERVRRTLGHGRIALWGGSWGTRTALLYQQWYPDSLSALVLDGVAPIDTKVFLAAAAAENALRQLQDDCAADPVCASFGDWRSQLDKLLADWSEEQARSFPDPLTGAPEKEPVERWMLASAIRAALYSPAAAAQIPFAVQQASRGNLQPLSGLVGLFSSSADTMAMGLTFSVACSEELNRISAEEVAADSADTFIGGDFYRLFSSGCEVWPVEAKPYGAPEPRSQPVLLISGSADPITPAYYAEEQLGYLSHKQHLVVAGGGHINSRRGCIPDLVAEFLKAPQQPLERECVAKIKRPPFMAATFGPVLGMKKEVAAQGGEP